MKPRPGNPPSTGYYWRDRLVWLMAALAFMLIMVGCGGGRNNLRSMEQGQNYAIDEEQEDFDGSELNAKRLEELYAKSGVKDRDRSIEEELRKLSHQSSIDFPIEMNKQVRAYIVYFATERKGFTSRSLERSSRYLPMIKEVFREYGLPEDLAYLAMVESGFNPNASSPAGACGMWQFIKGTGLRYGLVINNNVDERRDPEKSTRAAAQYLLDLYKQFGSWYLAAASYNCGERRVQKELSKSNYQNFWELSANKCIPGETRNYVPQMIAVTIIARNPKKFGFGNVPYQPPLTPQGEPNIAVAQVVSTGPAIKPAVRHAKASKVPIASTAAPKPPTITSPISRQKSTMHAKGVTKTATHRVCALDRKSPGKQVNHARPAPYVASLIGSPHAAPKKTEARKSKSTSSASNRSNGKPKKPKPSPALFAQKQKSKRTCLAKKPSTDKAKLSKSKAKAKSKA